MRNALILATALLSLTPFLPIPPSYQHADRERPRAWALVIVGGGKVGNEILTRMFDLAGRQGCPLVVIRRRAARTTIRRLAGLRTFKTFGATNITLLHTKDRKWRTPRSLCGRYRREDRVVRRRASMAARRQLLAHAHPARSGAACSSAVAWSRDRRGASILASYMVRGARENNYIMMAPGYEEASVSSKAWRSTSTC